MKTTRAFRWIWRLNAIAILLVALAALAAIATVTFSEMRSNRRAAADMNAAPVVKEADAQANLTLGAPSMVPGTQILRAELSTPGRGSSLGSYDSTETRNILFIHAVSGRSRWLLPSHRRVIEQSEQVFAPDDDEQDRAPLASAAMVKDSGATTGDLILFDATATRIVPIASGVRRLHSAIATSATEIVVVFDRDGRYVLARFEAPSLRKTGETPLAVPQL